MTRCLAAVRFWSSDKGEVMGARLRPATPRNSHSPPHSRCAATERRNGMKVQIMSPAADRVDFKVPPAPRLTSLEGKTIGLYNNMTGGADIAVERVAEHLSQRYPGVKFERYGGDP